MKLKPIRIKGTGTTMIIYVDMDDVIADFVKSYDEIRVADTTVEFPQSLPGFFENLEPIKDAVESVKLLIADPRFDVYVLTAPSTMNPLSYTEKRLWIEKYFGYPFTEHLIIASNKSLLKGDVLIDDNIEGKGQENFEGTLIQFGSAQYPDWPSVLLELERIVNAI